MSILKEDENGEKVEAEVVEEGADAARRGHDRGWQLNVN